MDSPVMKRVDGEGLDRNGSESSGSSSNNNGSHNQNNSSEIHNHSHSRSTSNGGSVFEFSGCVYHIGVNSIGHEFCRLRYLLIRGKYIAMYKRDPHENPGIRPIRKGVIGPTFMVQDLGRRRVNHKDLYVLQFYNRLDETKKGEIACAAAGHTQKWMEAFDHAKQQAEYELSRGGRVRNKLNREAEIDLEGHQPRIRRYANGFRKLIKIGQGPESLVRQSSILQVNGRVDGYYEGESGDTVEAHKWKCVCMINGGRIFEDVAESKSGKSALVKSVCVVDATADAVFEIVSNLEQHQRYEWDMLTGNLELLDSYDGHYDVVYGTLDSKYGSWWKSKKDFIFTRQWFRGQDGTYTILQFPAVHKKRPLRSGYQRIKISPSTWEIRNLNATKCLLTHMLEIHSAGWFTWKKNNNAKFEKSIPYALLCQVAGLKEYIGANPALQIESSTMVVPSKHFDLPLSSGEFEYNEAQDEFYDAIAADSSSDEEDEDNDEPDNKDMKVKPKNVSWAMKHSSALDANKELDPKISPINIDESLFPGTMHKGKDETDSNCWTSPSGRGFMIRGKTYLKDSSKVMGGDPLLKLIAVDWFKVDKTLDRVALHPSCLVQSDAGKKLPFILVINLQVPAKPNYSLVLYYAADRPVNKDSLLGRFVNGTDMFRDARFKLIPSIAQGYWMVKRAVGTKACLLGKAVTCNYLRQDNFLEIDVDIGSSSVARSVIGLVLGYVTSLVVDLAILIEAKEETELPEYILGTVRLNRVKPDAAVPLEV